MAKFICQHCGKIIEAPASTSGSKILCPECRQMTLLLRVETPPVQKPKLAVPPITPPKGLSTEQVSGIAAQIISNVERVIVGKHEQVVLATAALLAEGHLLIEDVPGVAKTMLARAIAQSTGCSFRRIQCTPDLLPSDVLGESSIDPETKRSEFHFGPLFSQFVLVDEINRASPRTQSALLEAMGESMVTVGKVTHPLEQPFIVIATQNPIEQEGTFALPEAQKDRFLIRMSLGYPSLKDEKQMCERFQLRHPIETLKAVTTPDRILACQQAVREVRVSPEVCDYILALVRATREHPALRLGASPRGSLGLFRTAQALAAIQGNDFVLAEQVKAIAPAVLNHRLLVRKEPEHRNIEVKTVMEEILGNTSAPPNQRKN
jgi:MoxR-like ATPase